MLSLDTLQMLRRCLVAQQLSVGDPDFAQVAAAASAALAELDQAISAAEATQTPSESQA
jgi:hypothetical protein